MTQEQKEIKNQLLQEVFDYYVWNKKFNDNYILQKLYNNGFCQSLAQATLKSIKYNVLKEYNK